jgi:DNA-binding YbaB/EbfC family protein
MNMQALAKQAQQMQKEIAKSKGEIDNTVFDGKSSLVSVSVNGKKEILKVNLSEEIKNLEDLEMLEDMILLAINDAFKKVDLETNKKMGKYSNMMSGLM